MFESLRSLIRSTASEINIVHVHKGLMRDKMFAILRYLMKTAHVSVDLQRFFIYFKLDVMLFYLLIITQNTSIIQSMKHTHVDLIIYLTSALLIPLK